MDATIMGALIGIGGTLVGAVAGGGVQIWTQRKKERRDDKALWDRQLVELVAASVKYSAAVQTIRAGWVDGQKFWELLSSERTTALEIHTILSPAMDRLLHAVAMVTTWRDGDPKVVEQAQVLGDATGELLAALSAGPEEFTKRADEFADALRELRVRIDARK